MENKKIEIDKLYENAGIKDKCGYICSAKGIGCNKCPNKNRKFTAEKQIELIKWLMKEEKVLQIELRYIEDDFCFSRVTPCDTNINANYVSFGRARKFEEALADLINDIWQSLTEEEKEQVKGILE